MREYYRRIQSGFSGVLGLWWLCLRGLSYIPMLLILRPWFVHQYLCVKKIGYRTTQNNYGGSTKLSGKEKYVVWYLWLCIDKTVSYSPYAEREYEVLWNRMSKTINRALSRTTLRGIIIEKSSIFGVYSWGVPIIRADCGDTERSLWGGNTTIFRCQYLRR